MASLKKTCGLWLLVYFVCAAAIGGIVARRFLIAGIPAAVIGGGLLWLGFAYLSGIPEKMRRARRIRDSLAGQPMRDGEIAAIAGRIMPLAETLVSPFTHTTCVAYSYQIRKPQGRHSAPWEYKGVALVPTVIQGPHGSLKLLALPALDVKETFCRGDEALVNARQYIDQSEFSVPVPFHPTNTTSPRVRYDHRTPHSESDLSRTMLYERVVTPGQQVCAIGLYSAAQGGLTHETDSIVPTLTLMDGDGAAVQHTLIRRSIGNALAGIAFIFVTLFGVVFFYHKVPLAAAEQMEPNRRTWWWEVRVDRWLKNDSGAIPTGVAPRFAQGRIEAAGREIHPEWATASHEAGIIKLTLRDQSGDVATAGIDANNQTLTSLEIAGEAVPPHAADLEIVRVDKESIEGRLTYLDGENDPRCRVAFNANFTSSR